MTDLVAPVVVGARLTCHQLPFREPLLLQAGVREQEGRQSLSRPHTLRKFALLELQLSGGYLAIGELAPLPGFSEESLDQAIPQLFQIVKKIISCRCEATVCGVSRQFPEFKDCYPSVQFAIEMALVACAEKARQVPDAQQQSHTMPVKTAVLLKPVAGIIVGPNADDFRKAPNSDIIVDAGFTLGKGRERFDRGTSAIQGREPLPFGQFETIKTETIKLKVARESNNPQSVGKLINDLQHYVAVNPEVTFRIDVNQGWSYAQAQEFTQLCKGLPVDFIEEPCRDLRDNIKLLEHGCPVALDETLQHKAGLHPFQFAGFSVPWVACIFKPTLMGGQHGCQPWIDYCQANGVRVVVSSSFESPLGLSYLARLAGHWAPDEVHGLDTLDAFTAADISSFYAGNIPDNGLLQWTI